VFFILPQTRVPSVLETSGVRVNIEIMRAFVRLREMMASHRDLARKLEILEQKYDAQFKVVFDAIRQLMAPPEPRKRQIGFLVKEKSAQYGKT
jgi:DnaJ-domain-containing protein 1